MRMPSAGSAEENPSMTKAVGPKHNPDLWKVHAKSQVFSTAGSSPPPPSFSISFLSFMIPPFLYSPLSLLLSLHVSLQSMLSLCQTDFSVKKGEIKVLGRKERGRKTLTHTIYGRVGLVVEAAELS